MTNPSGPPTAFDSLTVDGVPTMGMNGLPLTIGNVFFVDETLGSDGNTGSATNPFKTLSFAQGKCVANHNDVVAFQGTIHQTSSLVWDKAQTHLVGICAPIKRGKRARISVSGSTGFDKLVSVTAAGCQFANFGTFYGWTDASTALLAWSDTGGRSSYNNVEFMGFGDDTASTGSANLTGSRAFKFNTNTGESTFRNCVFGVDTTDRGATNYTLEIAGGAPRMYFYDCDFEARLAAGGTGGSHVLIGASGIDRYAKFIGCRFGNFSTSAMAQAFNVNAAPGGTVWLDQCTAGPGVTAWQTTPVAALVMNMVAATTTGGLTHTVF